MPEVCNEDNQIAVPRRVLIVEDLAPAAALYADYVKSAFPGASADVAASLSDARECLAQRAYDLALLDLGLPDGDGTALLAEGRFGARCVVVVVTIFDDDAHLFGALQAGADGYLVKDSPEGDWLQGLRGILTGQPPLSASVARRMVESFRPRPAPTTVLTPREQEVLLLVAKGCSVPETADVLGLRVNTVGSYVKEIYRKLQVNSRAEATLEAARLGLISVDP